MIIRLSDRKARNARYHLRDDIPVNYNPGEEYPYAISVMENDYIIDVRIVRTEKTLDKMLKFYFYKHNLDILVYPQPVRPTQSFFEEYKQTRSGRDRIALFKKYGILEETNILFINKLILDIDSPFDSVISVFNDLKISPDAIDIIKTKRGRFRAVIHLRPTPKRHLNKAKEMIEIFNSYFNKYDLNADSTFKNIQHPIWLKKHKKNQEAEEEIINYADNTIGFFDLYRIAKSIQKKHKLYNNKNKEKSQLQLQSKTKNRVRRKRIRKSKKYINAPSFIGAKNIDVLGVLEKAVDTLWHTKRGGIYLYFIQVVAGWVKHLGLDESLYWELMNKYIPERVKDIKIGWRYARPLEFNYKIIDQRYKLKELIRDALDYIRISGEVKRQELLRKVFNNQSWLEQKVMNYLIEKGRVEETFKKQNGKGRPSKAYTLKKDSKSQKKEKKIIRKLSKKTLLSAIFVKPDNEKHFRHIITPPIYRGGRGGIYVFLSLGSGGGWCSKKILLKSILIDNDKKELLNRYWDKNLFRIFEYTLSCEDKRCFSFDSFVHKIFVKNEGVLLPYHFDKKVSANPHLVKKNLATFQGLGYFFRKNALNFYQLKTCCLPTPRSPPFSLSKRLRGLCFSPVSGSERVGVGVQG